MTSTSEDTVGKQLTALEVGCWAGVIGFVVFILCTIVSVVVDLDWSPSSTRFSLIAAAALFLAFTCWSWSFVLVLTHTPREFVRCELRRMRDQAQDQASPKR